MRTRTKGIQVAGDGGKLINKQYKGRRIFTRLGAVSQDAAERWLRAEQDRIDAELARGAAHHFYDAAEKYLKECAYRQVRTLDTIGYHVTLVLPYIGMNSLESVHGDTLQPFIAKRLEEDGASPTTVNRTLEVVRTILNRAARVWRGDDGRPWLASAPLIEMLDETPRKPHPLSWEEQRRLFAELPPHLERMALFAVNTGLRDNNVCGLRWSWEVHVPELENSVFVIPRNEFKSDREHVVILNAVARSVVESCRGRHADYLFTFRNAHKDTVSTRMETMNNTAWQKARKRAGLVGVRVHDLRHTFAQRLRQAGVTAEDRSLLLGHATVGMAEHYATATIERLIAMANQVQDTRDTATVLRVVNSR